MIKIVSKYEETLAENLRLKQENSTLRDRIENLKKDYSNLKTHNFSYKRKREIIKKNSNNLVTITHQTCKGKYLPLRHSVYLNIF